MISVTFDKTKLARISKSLGDWFCPTIQIIGPSIFDKEYAVAPVSVDLESLIHIFSSLAEKNSSLCSAEEKEFKDFFLLLNS
jgi:hypothetical protein